MIGQVKKSQGDIDKIDIMTTVSSFMCSQSSGNIWSYAVWYILVSVCTGTFPHRLLFYD